MEGYNILFIFDDEGDKAQVQNGRGDRMSELDICRREGETLAGLLARALSNLEEDLVVEVVAVVPWAAAPEHSIYTREGDLIGETFWVFARPDLGDQR